MIYFDHRESEEQKMCALRYDRKRKVNYRILKTNKIIKHPRTEKASNIEPVTKETQQLSALKRLIGVFLIILAFLFAQLLCNVGMTAKCVIITLYVCVQIFLWSDISLKRQ